MRRMELSLLASCCIACIRSGVKIEGSNHGGGGGARAMKDLNFVALECTVEKQLAPRAAGLPAEGTHHLTKQNASSPSPHPKSRVHLQVKSPLPGTRLA